MEVDGKVAIVTGASGGIGKATAQLLSQNGAKVALVARSKEKLEVLSKELPGSFVVVADMSKPDEVREMVQKVFEQYDKVDILVNNAGRGYDAPIEKINLTTFQEIINLDLLGLLIAMQEVIPLMRKEGQSAIVNISSGTALMALPNMAAYSSLKRAVVGFSLTAREEVKDDGISVSIVYPYITATDFEKNTIKDVLQEGWKGDSNLPPADSSEYVADLILKAIRTGEAEIFAHEWMGK